MSSRLSSILIGLIFLTTLFSWQSCTPTQVIGTNTNTTTKKDSTTQNTTTTSRFPKRVDPDTIKLTPDPFSALVQMDTKFGAMKIELFFDASKHRENFLKLIQENFYDSLLFHRVIRGFMVQGGDPKSRNAKPEQRLGSGGPAYKIDAEINNSYYHIKGALAAARQPDETNPEKKSSGSQFYIVHGNPIVDSQLDKIERKYDFVYTPEHRRLYTLLGGAPQLDREYTVFGRVYEGFNIIDSIANSPTDGYNRPKDDVHMKFTIIRE